MWARCWLSHSVIPTLPGRNSLKATGALLRTRKLLLLSSSCRFIALLLLLLYSVCNWSLRGSKTLLERTNDLSVLQGRKALQCISYKPANWVMHTASSGQHQCFFFSRNIGEDTPKFIYFHYLKNSFLDQSNLFLIILKTEAPGNTICATGYRMTSTYCVAAKYSTN